MTSDCALLYPPEVITSQIRAYLQPHPLEEDGPQQVAFAVGSQQAICSAGGQQGDGLFDGGALSIGCLGEGFSFTWDGLS